MRKLYYLIKAFFINLENIQEWEDDLIMCPSQCYYYFKHKGKNYCLYLRWRHDDPWTADLIHDATPDNYLGGWDFDQWQSVPVSFFTHDDLYVFKRHALMQVKFILAGYYES